MIDDRDQLLRFGFEGMPVRGALVNLRGAWQAIRERNGTVPSVESLLGEAVAASALMFSNIKLKGQIALQLQGSGALSLLLAQCTHEGDVRAVVDVADDQLTGVEDFSTLTRGSHLAITLERYDSGQRYQGIVSLAGGSLAAGLEGYFRQSEQLPTRIWLAADGAHAAGLMLQQMPGETEDDDGWNRVATLADTVTLEELLALSPVEVLRRLYHREHVLVFDERPLQFGCRCDRQRVEEVLRMLGRDDIMAAVDEAGELEVNCEFCNELYRFDRVDLAQVFSDSISGSGPDTYQ